MSEASEAEVVARLGAANSRLRELLEDQLSPARLRRQGVLVSDEVERIKREHRQQVADHTFKLWYMLSLSSWLDHFQVTV